MTDIKRSLGDTILQNVLWYGGFALVIWGAFEVHLICGLLVTGIICVVNGFMAAIGTALKAEREAKENSTP